MWILARSMNSCRKLARSPGGSSRRYQGRGRPNYGQIYHTVVAGGPSACLFCDGAKRATPMGAAVIMGNWFAGALGPDVYPIRVGMRSQETKWRVRAVFRSARRPGGPAS